MKEKLQTHCCTEMETFLESGEVSIYYSDVERFYALPYKPRRGGGMQIINFCPWCGRKLPSPLIEEYAHLVFDELKLDPLDPHYRKKLPREFKTAEWWRKREL